MIKKSCDSLKYYFDFNIRFQYFQHFQSRDQPANH